MTVCRRHFFNMAAHFYRRRKYNYFIIGGGISLPLMSYTSIDTLERYSRIPLIIRRMPLTLGGTMANYYQIRRSHHADEMMQDN